MSHTLYNALIYPLVHLMEGLLALFYRHTESYGISIILLSVGVNTLIAPFYALADKWQNEEQDLLRQMKGRLQEIKEVFKGDERHFYLRALYRLHGYSPLMSIRSSFGLLIQIPFFMAAYSFLSHYEALNGQSFLVLRDLARPDKLLGPVNIMPFVMTGINVVSALLFTKGQNLRSRVQLFAMAGFFLIVLYNSPAGLLLYWTCNNLFSLLRILYKKSILASFVSRIPNGAEILRKKITLPPMGIAVLLILAYGIFLKLFIGDSYLYSDNIFLSRLFMTGIFIYLSCIGTLFFFEKYQNNFAFHLNLLLIAGLWAVELAGLLNFSNTSHFVLYYEAITLLLVSNVALPVLYRFNDFWEEKQLLSRKETSTLFYKSLFSLFLMISCIIPFLLLNDAPGEISLSFGDYSKMLVWALLYVVFLPLFLHGAIPGELKKTMAVLAFTFLVWGLLDFLFFPGNYGYINESLQFSLDISNSRKIQFLNIGLLGCSLGTVLAVFIFKPKIITYISFLLALSLSAVSAFALLEYRFVTMKKIDLSEAGKIYLEPEIPLSKTKPNTVILMMDRALGGAVPSWLEAYPELEDDFSGFTWYKNTISYGGGTLIGLPGILGGYEYTPKGMLARPDFSVQGKIEEAWTVLPEIFQSLNHSVLITDPSYEDISAGDRRSTLAKMGVNISHLQGKYADYWLKENMPWAYEYYRLNQRGKAFFMFSLFRLAPIFFKDDIFDKGMWHCESMDPEIRKKTGNWNNFMQALKEWSTLEYLPELISIIISFEYLL